MRVDFGIHFHGVCSCFEVDESWKRCISRRLTSVWKRIRPVRLHVRALNAEGVGEDDSLDVHSRLVFDIFSFRLDEEASALKSREWAAVPNIAATSL